MSNETQQFECAACHCPLERLAQDNAEACLVCPQCGASDNVENVLAELPKQADEHVIQKVHQGRRKAVWDGNHLKLSTKVKPKRRLPRT